MTGLIVRFRTPDGAVRVGLLREDVIHECADAEVATIVRADADTRTRLLAAAIGDGTQWRPDDVALLAPIDGRMEVWACGVTYVRSRDARMEESDRTSDIYDRVYDAQRPELFFKSASWRVVGPAGTVTIRRDSTISVPEPELAVVLDPRGAVVGLTICNDMSSRDIEGENPLYLPQAKIWLGACAMGPGIVLIDDIADAYDLDISMSIVRNGTIAFTESTSTSHLHRRFEELATWAFVEDEHPDGIVLSTGTGIVPDLSFTLMPSDEIEISIERIGTLTNPVGLGKEAYQP